MKLVLLGPPGAGKGTQANVLSNKFGVVHISTGDILREAVKNDSETGLLAKTYMDKGDLVPDEIVLSLVAEKISKDDAKKGFILDGFPRNKNQAIELENRLKNLEMKLDMVLYFKTKESTSIERLTGRRICPKCGLNYHIKNRAPKKDNICDACGIGLIHRQDDKVKTIKNRLKIYKNQTQPLLKYYKNSGLLRDVPGDLDVDALFKKLKTLFENENLI
ncbi:MAG: adenylate kinase [Candidatus Omnitrophica bacterium]|nr:adenylate kinase [Candidatus Omnitrophota bacterium]